MKRRKRSWLERIFYMAAYKCRICGLEQVMGRASFEKANHAAAGKTHG